MAKLPKKFEGTKSDMMGDKARAKRMGMSMPRYEKSPADKKHDMMGQKKRGKK